MPAGNGISGRGGDVLIGGGTPTQIAGLVAAVTRAVLDALGVGREQHTGQAA